jgi:hypothetical protein
MLTNQNVGCSKGDSFAFEIDTQDDTDPATPPVDLSGATGQWVLAESWFDGAKIYLTKTPGSGLYINQDSGVWKVIVQIAPADTISIPSGILYHDCKVTLSDGTVAHVASGEFILDASVNP